MPGGGALAFLLILECAKAVPTPGHLHVFSLRTGALPQVAVRSSHAILGTTVPQTLGSGTPSSSPLAGLMGTHFVQLR